MSSSLPGQAESTIINQRLISARFLEFELTTPIPHTGLSEWDYSLIEAAVMETVRGRWFLAEFARRNRVADTQVLLDALARIERAAGLSAPALEAAPPLLELSPPLALPPEPPASVPQPQPERYSRAAFADFDALPADEKLALFA